VITYGEQRVIPASLRTSTATEARRFPSPRHAPTYTDVIPAATTSSATRFNDLDTGFHLQLARCSGNELTRTLTAAVRESPRPSLREAWRNSDNPATSTATVRTQHREILRLIRHGEPDKAADAVEHHIRTFHGKLAEDER
jgi:DNA-binding FadR family transcriptional regulator